jgi:hypothetical protein
MAPVDATERIREAKIFLASRITDEAERQGAPLSEIERKMLYFADSGWTLSDMGEVNEVFAREYDRRHFEKRIGRLIRSLRARLKAGRDSQEYETWSAAIQDLKDARENRQEDHYLLKLIAAAPPEGEITRLIFTALVVVGVMLLALFLATRGY